MLNTFFSPWPSFSKEEADSIRDVLLTNKVNYWTGNECREFEKEFADWVGVKHSIALANGTLALDVALKALDIGPGDEVIVTPRTFIASISCVVNAGATPVFADIDGNSGNISAETIAVLITPNTKAIIPVHLGGFPCDMDPIMELANRYGLKVIEDCAQAHGARYKGRSVGSIGHIGAWSFCQDKIMTTGGEGGMVTTNDPALWSKMWSYKDHGKSYDAVYKRAHPPGFRWLHESFGTNWRMLEIQAVIGRIQLRLMSEWTKKRTLHANLIRNICKKYSIVRLPVLDENNGATQHAYYKCYIYLNKSELSDGWSRDRIIDELNSRGIPCFQGSCSEVYLEKAFDDTGWRPAVRLPVAKDLGESSLMLLVHPTLNEAEIEKTCNALDLVFAMASK
ncbi:DegT/DnrJ/EryC1/StrS aminotransferase family protein [Polynucleobacter paneuropaeus]|nr:DegT/DnrJ/EryC1/StrS aminotransferase family protein [Polynucleobacter paneuropaeus]